MKLSSIPSLVVEQALNGNIIPVLHDDIIDEYRRVLDRGKFDFNQNLVDMVIYGFNDRGIFVEAADIDIDLPDAKDEIFYAAALTAREYIDDDTRIITGNMKHFPHVSFAITPREALNILLQEG